MLACTVLILKTAGQASGRPGTCYSWPTLPHSKTVWSLCLGFGTFHVAALASPQEAQRIWVTLCLKGATQTCSTNYERIYSRHPLSHPTFQQWWKTCLLPHPYMAAITCFLYGTSWKSYAASAAFSTKQKCYHPQSETEKTQDGWWGSVPHSTVARVRGAKH